MLLKKAVLNTYATVCVIVLINLLAFFWAKIILRYEKLGVSEKIIEGLNDRRYIEFRLIDEELVILELNDSKTQLLSIFFHSPSRDWTFFFDEATGMHTLEIEGQIGFYDVNHFLPSRYYDTVRKKGFSFNENLEPIWIEN
jgi:hypothetical protein